MVAEGVIVDMLDAAVATAAEDGCSIAFVAVDGALAGLLAFRDEPRSEAAAAIQAVRDAGLTPVMISGDNPAAVAVIAKRLGTDGCAGWGSARYEGGSDPRAAGAARRRRVCGGRR